MKINHLFEEGEKHITFCFGRMNPPTIGHKQLLDTMSSVGGDMRIFVSASQDPKKNPLSYSQKIDFMRKLFPDYAGDIVENSSLNTVMKVAAYLYNQGYSHATFVAGSDRLEDMKKMLEAYNGKEEGKKGPLPKETVYKFDTLNFVSSGEREDGAEGVAGVSASAARAAAANSDLTAFTKATGAGEYAEELYKAVRKGMGLDDKEESMESRLASKLASLTEGWEDDWERDTVKAIQAKGPKRQKATHIAASNLYKDGELVLPKGTELAQRSNKLYVHLINGRPQGLYNLKSNLVEPVDSVSEAPIEMDPEDPMNPMIVGTKSNPAKLKYRMLRAAKQLAELAKRAEDASPLGWQSIARNFKELSMNIDEIEHGLAELAKTRKKGGIKSRGIDPNIESIEESAWTIIEANIDKTIDRLRWTDVKAAEPLKRLSNAQLKTYAKDFISKNPQAIQQFMKGADTMGGFMRPMIQQMAPKYIPATKDVSDDEWQNIWKSYDNIDPKVKDKIKAGDLSDFESIEEADLVLKGHHLRGTVIDLIKDRIQNEKDIETLSRWLKMIVGKTINPRGENSYTITSEDVREAIQSLKESKMKASEIKPRNFVAKNAPKAGAGAHKDKKKAMKQGEQKHKGKVDEASYEHPAGKELARLGRIIMDKAASTKDDKLSNVMARVGDELTRFGAPGGASSLPELEKKAGVPYAMIEKLMKFAMKQKDTSLAKVKDPTPSKDDEIGDFEQ